MIFKKIERTPEQNRKLIKIQIALDIVVIIFVVCALAWAVPRVNEIVKSSYDYCYLCMQDESINCLKDGQLIYWEGEEVPNSAPTKELIIIENVWG